MASSSEPVLPIEILEEVIDVSADDEQVLRALALTCSTFAPRCQKILFRGIRWTYGVSEGLFHLLMSSPRIRRLIKHLTIADETEDVVRFVWHHPLCGRIFERLPPTLSSITLSGDWTVELDDDRIEPHEFISCPPSESQSRWFFERLADISYHPNFEGIDATFHPQREPPVFLFLPKLRNVSLLYFERQLPNTLRWRTFSEYTPEPIQSLKVCYRGGHPSVGKPQGARTVSSWLNLQSLKMLSVDLDDSFIDNASSFGWIDDYLVPSYDLLQVLSLTLRRFVINQDAPPPPGLNLSRLPNLRSLRISFADLYSARRTAGWLSRFLATAAPRSTLDELVVVLPQSIDLLTPFDDLLSGVGYLEIKSLKFYNYYDFRTLEDVRKSLPKLASYGSLSLQCAKREDVNDILWSGY